MVNASSSNIFTIDFSRDHNAIKKKLRISEYAKIVNFHVSFENSGSIETLRYIFLTKDSKDIILYEVKK